MNIIAHFMVDSGGVDTVIHGPPSRIYLAHNTDFAVLTGPATYTISVISNGNMVSQYRVSVALDELVMFTLEEGTDRYPGNWDMSIEIEQTEPGGFLAPDLIKLRRRPITFAFLNEQEVSPPVMPGALAPTGNAAALIGTGIVGMIAGGMIFARK